MPDKTIIITGIPRSGLKIACKFLSGQAGWVQEQERRFPHTTVYSDRSMVPLCSNAGFHGDVFSQDPAYMYEWKPIHRLYPEACWIIVRRDATSIIQACKKTDWISYCTDNKCWNKWHDANLEIIKDMKCHINWREVWPTACLNGDLSSVRSAVKHFQLKEV